jgi:hypothetical protein
VAVVDSTMGLVSVRIKSSGKPIWEIVARPAAVLTRADNRIFLAECREKSDYVGDGAPGCSYRTLVKVTAYDMTSGAFLWMTQLDGPGHGVEGTPGVWESSEIRLNLAVIDGVLVVRGKKPTGRFIECLSLEPGFLTGETLWCERFKD